MYRPLICVACLVALPWTVNVHAQPPAEAPTTEQPEVSAKRQALVNELLVLTKQEENANRMMEAMLAQSETMLPQLISETLSKTTTLKDDALQEQVTQLATRLVRRYRELLPQRVDIGKVTTQINAELYAKYYTEAELQGLIDFYQTPLGQKTIDITPQLSAEALQRSNQILLPQITDVIQEIMKEELGQLQPDSETPAPDSEAPASDSEADPKK